MPMELSSRSWVPASGASLYAVCLALPTYSPFNSEFSDTVYSGADAFRCGWRMLIAWEPAEPDWWVLSAAWLANPVTCFAVVMAAAGRWRVAAIAAGCGMVLCLVVLPRFGGMVIAHPGFWAWSGSAVLILVGSSLALGRRERG